MNNPVTDGGKQPESDPTADETEQQRQWECPTCRHTEDRHHNERKRPFCDRCESRDAILIEMKPVGPGSEKIMADGGQPDNGNRRNVRERFKPNWFLLGYVGVGVSMVMSTACEFGPCAPWAGEIWLIIGVVVVLLSIGGYKYA